MPVPEPVISDDEPTAAESDELMAIIADRYAHAVRMGAAVLAGALFEAGYRKVGVQPGVPAVDHDRHEYLSTGCWHGRHDYCQAMTGYQGAKRPGQCKWCDARCICRCHRDGVVPLGDVQPDGER